MRQRFVFLVVAAAVIGGMILWLPLAHRTQARALARAEAYAQAIDQDYQTPEKIYRFLCADFRARMSEADFCAAWEKERSYPYITPLYLFWPEVTAYSGDTAQVTFLRAARIEGMTYPVELIYENGDYYVQDWASFLDGSYLEKFEDIPYSLDWYYDT